jgi:uncharacterized protein (UPF0335 family)
MTLMANSLEGKAENYLRRIQNLLDDLESEKGSYMARCKPIREDIDDIYVEAKENGLPKKVMKDLVDDERAEKKRRSRCAKHDIDEAAIYDELREKLGPLGAAAAKREGYAPADIEADDDRDFRPTNLRNTNPDDLNKVGRGPAAEAS